MVSKHEEPRGVSDVTRRAVKTQPILTENRFYCVPRTINGSVWSEQSQKLRDSVTCRISSVVGLTRGSTFWFLLDSEAASGCAVLVQRIRVCSWLFFFLPATWFGIRESVELISSTFFSGCGHVRHPGIGCARAPGEKASKEK